MRRHPTTNATQNATLHTDNAIGDGSLWLLLVTVGTHIETFINLNNESNNDKR